MRAIASRHSVPLAIATVLTFVLGVGISTAATSGGKSVKACVSAKGILGVQNSAHHCAKGFRPTTIAKAGPRGPRGLQGHIGVPGTNNIVPLRYVQSNADAAAGTWTTIAVDGNMEVQADCYTAAVSLYADLRLVSTIDVGGDVSTVAWYASGDSTNTATTGYAVGSSSGTPSGSFATTAGGFSSSQMSVSTMSFQLGATGPQVTGIISIQALPAHVLPTPACIFDGTLTNGPSK